MRQQGHDDALAFALAIGLKKDYRRDQKAKKDVIDPAGDAHSVKSGQTKWQIFLYGRDRFITDDGWATMDGVGSLLVACIDSFPQSFTKYEANKAEAKEALRPHMKALAGRLWDVKMLRAFLGKSLFNGAEVDYLTVKEGEQFHVFWGREVVRALAANFTVANSVARAKGQFPEQKVILLYTDKNVGEIEMRNESPGHYKEVRFNMNKAKAVQMLFKLIPAKRGFSDKVVLHGKARTVFGSWLKKKR